MKRIISLGLIVILSLSILSGCSKPQASSDESTVANDADKPSTFIADRTIKGLVFMSPGDVSPEMNPEIIAELKKKTGITLELQGITDEDSQKALAAGLAAGDLPDFISFYLDHSGRPEMQTLLKASNEGMFTDIGPMLKESKVYSKYFEEGYLPKDTKDNVMFRKEFNGATYFVHMSVPREGGTVTRRYVGGPYIRKDIVETLKIDPASIDTSEKLHDLAKKIQQQGFKDNNGNPITVIGPTVWGGKDRQFLYNDLVWTGPSGEKFLEKDGKILHESQTDYGKKRVTFIRQLMKEKLMHPEFFTMEENRSRENIVNRSFGIVADMHNFVPENNDMKYVPLGPIQFANGPYRMQLKYKSASCGWAVPKTTKNPEDIVKFADFLASREGKLLSNYGIEGRDYTLDDKGNPVVKQEVLALKKDKPDEAKKLGFRGVRAYWSDHLGYTDLDNLADFGEAEYGLSQEGSEDTPQKILDMWKYDEKFKNADVIDGSTAKAFIFEYEKGKDLNVLLNDYNDVIQKAIYSESDEQSQKLLTEMGERLKAGGIEDYEKLVEKKKAEGVKIRY